MSRGSHVVVHRGGFLTAVAYGFFAFLTASVVCALGVGVYAVNVVDRKAESLLGVGSSVLVSLPEILPEIKAALPPALSDAWQDRRDPQYRDHVDLRVNLLPRETASSAARLVIEATNKGTETITLLAIRVVLLDEAGAPVRSVATYAATPVTIDHDWRGPLMPGSTRRCGMTLRHCDKSLTAEAEITDLRVWSAATAAPPASDTD